MKIFKIKVLTYFLAAGVLFGIQSCTDDILEEITEFNVSRLFSPVDVEARVVNQTSIRLNWNRTDKATSYVIEVFEGIEAEGTPVLTISNVSFDDLPYTIPNLAGETTYTIQVKAVGAGIPESRWSPVQVTTDTEQLFQPVNPEDLTPTSATLRWVAGQQADKIIIMPGNIEHQVTQEEVAEGVAVVEGLSGETTYTASLMLGFATRGTVTFTTLIDLDGAIAVNPGDDIKTLFENASDGDVFALLPGIYRTGDITISKSISIKGAKRADRPVLDGTIFRVENNASLELKDLILDGANSQGGNQTIIYSAGTFGELVIDGCDITNYTKGTLYVNNAALIELVSITNNIYSDIECNGGDFIDFRNGIARQFDFINNTAYNSALARDFFRMDAGGSNNFPDVNSIITIRNNTFDKVSDGSNRRMLYIRLANHEITFEKNILSNTQGYYSNQAATNVVKFDKNNYFNAPNFTASTQSNAKNDGSGSHLSEDPGYANAAAGDFTISNEELKFQGIGDSRWNN